MLGDKIMRLLYYKMIREFLVIWNSLLKINYK